MYAFEMCTNVPKDFRKVDEQQRNKKILTGRAAFSKERH